MFSELFIFLDGYPEVSLDSYYPELEWGGS